MPEEPFKCTACGGTETETIETPRLVHFAKIRCAKCKKFVKWISNPENGFGRKKTSKFEEWQVFQHYHMTKKMCFFCERERNELGEKETFTIDHIIQITDGGKDILENTQILCTSCHKLKNWAILYMNKHHKRGDTDVDSTV